MSGHDGYVALYVDDIVRGQYENVPKPGMTRDRREYAERSKPVIELLSRIFGSKPLLEVQQGIDINPNIFGARSTYLCCVWGIDETGFANFVKETDEDNFMDMEPDEEDPERTEALAELEAIATSICAKYGVEVIEVSEAFADEPVRSGMRWYVAKGNVSGEFDAYIDNGMRWELQVGDFRKTGKLPPKAAKISDV